MAKHLFPWTRREMVMRADKGEGRKRLAFEYGIELSAFDKIYNRWKMLKRLEAFFQDLASKISP